MERKTFTQNGAFFTFSCQFSGQKAHILILNFFNHQIDASFNKTLYYYIANTN